MDEKIIYKDLSYKVIGLAMEIHKKLGYGFLEKVYENALMVIFKRNNIKAEQQKKIKIIFMNEIVGDYIADVLVEDKIIIELKCVSSINSAHKAQVSNYLKATGIKLGLIINFSKKSLEYERVVL